MPAKSLTDQQIIETLRAVERHGGINQAARALGLHRASLQHRLREGKARQIGDLVVEQGPDTRASIDEILGRKRSQFARAKAAQDFHNLVNVAVPDDRPIGVLLVGDPHVDDDGCDIAQLEHDLSTVGRTPGFYAGHVGDLTNNWVGRLAALYAHQSSTFDEALQLVEWMLGLCRNLFLVNGNHDVWNNGADLLRFIAGSKIGLHQSHGVRLALNWPGGEQIRIHARHDFPGKSQFSATHGMKRELLWGHRDHILVAGHTHVDEARVEPSLEGEVHWAFRVSGYKILDAYADTHRFRPQRLAPSTAVILDPKAAIPAERVKPFWDVDEAAAVLAWKRKRAA